MSNLKPTRFPAYDVMAKRNTPSFNAKTRDVLGQRLAIAEDDPKFLTIIEFVTLKAIADRIVPQPDDRLPIPVAALIDHRLQHDKGDGFRTGHMPRQREAWRKGLAALNAESQAAYDRPFRDLDNATRDLMLRKMHDGELKNAAWKPMTSKQFFKERLMHDIVITYYSHPAAWSEMGFGGPASPRGYVRMGANERDPWEAAETRGDAETARNGNLRVGR